MKSNIKLPIENHNIGKEPIDTTEGFNDNSKTKKHIIKKLKAKYGYLLIGLIIVALIAIVYVAAINTNSAHITISANFSEITDGHNPDGSPFDIYEVMSDEVLKSACDKLDNKINIQTLKKHISVTGITTDGKFNAIRQNVLDGNDTYSYFPSRYSVTYSVVSDAIAADGFFSSIAAVFKQIVLPSKEQILHAITDSYQEYYSTNYVATSEIFDIDWSEIKSLDYYNRVSKINNILNRMSRYLAKRYDEDVKFISKDGASFGDLNAEVTGIMQNDIESYKAFIIQNGVTNDRDKLLKQFTYVLKSHNEQIVKNRGEYEIILDGISIYDPSVTKVVFIPSVNSDNVLYMNRTKMGIDYLTESASNASLEGDKAENDANYCRYLINQFGSIDNSETWKLNIADKRCDEIITKVNDLCRRAVDINDEYINSVSYEFIEISNISSGAGLVSFVITVIKLIVIWSSVLYILWIIYSVLEKKIKGYMEECNTNVNS